MSLLTVSNVSKHFGAEQILDDVSLRIERDDHVGLVGSNGAGKSTLLRIIAGIEEPDTGTVAGTRGLLVGYLEQEPEFVETETLYEVMLGVYREAIEAQERIQCTRGRNGRRQWRRADRRRVWAIAGHRRTCRLRLPIADRTRADGSGPSCRDLG